MSTHTPRPSSDMGTTESTEHAHQPRRVADRGPGWYGLRRPRRPRATRGGRRRWSKPSRPRTPMRPRGATMHRDGQPPAMTLGRNPPQLAASYRGYRLGARALVSLVSGWVDGDRQSPAHATGFVRTSTRTYATLLNELSETRALRLHGKRMPSSHKSGQIQSNKSGSNLEDSTKVAPESANVCPSSAKFGHTLTKFGLTLAKLDQT